MAESAPERTPPDDTTEALTHDDDGALTDLAMEASDAIRAFPFADFGVDVGDPNDEDAAWVFELAVAATEAVVRGLGLSLKQAAGALLAEPKEADRG